MQLAPGCVRLTVTDDLYRCQPLRWWHSIFHIPSVRIRLKWHALCSVYATRNDTDEVISHSVFECTQSETELRISKHIRNSRKITKISKPFNKPDCAKTEKVLEIEHKALTPTIPTTSAKNAQCDLRSNGSNLATSRKYVGWIRLHRGDHLRIAALFSVMLLDLRYLFPENVCWMTSNGSNCVAELLYLVFLVSLSEGWSD